MAASSIDGASTVGDGSVVMVMSFLLGMWSVSPTAPDPGWRRQIATTVPSWTSFHRRAGTPLARRSPPRSPRRRVGRAGCSSSSATPGSARRRWPARPSRWLAATTSRRAGRRARPEGPRSPTRRGSPCSTVSARTAGPRRARSPAAIPTSAPPPPPRRGPRRTQRCSTPSNRPPPRARRCWCSTTCTGPTREPCNCSTWSPPTCRRGRCSSSAPIATPTSRPARRSPGSVGAPSG